MRYIKTYENIINNLQAGDYVILDYELNWNVDTLVKVIAVDDERVNIETYFKDTNKYIDFFVQEDEIDRKATPQEIKDYKILKDANKFNL